MMMSLWLNECFGTIENKNMRGFRHRLAKAYTSIYDTAPIQSLILLSLKIRICWGVRVGEIHVYSLVILQINLGKTFSGTGPEIQRGCFNKQLLEIIMMPEEGDSGGTSGGGGDGSLTSGCTKFPGILLRRVGITCMGGLRF